MTPTQPPLQPPARPPFHAMAKPIGPVCNLACDYCFYLEKQNLHPAGHTFRMSDEVLEAFVRGYCQSQDTPTINFAWQGGEPTLMGVAFFRRAVELQRIHAAGRPVTNSLQTNGVLLDDEWGEFLAANQFLVGLSIDGPSDLHDAHRRDKRGNPSFDSVMRGLEVLKKHRVEFNTLTVVNSLNGDRPLEVYRFLKEIGSVFHQYIPLVERASDPRSKQLGLRLGAPPALGEPTAATDPFAVTGASVGPEQFGRFLKAIFDEWVRHDVGTVFVQLFETALSHWVGAGSGLCVFAETCGRAVIIEHDGSVYSCDHYVYPDYHLGNVLSDDLRSLVESGSQRRFGDAKRDAVPDCCGHCDVAFICNGDCPKHRFVPAPPGDRPVSYLCLAYKALFRHMAPHLDTMAELLHRQLSPAGIMEILRHRESGKPHRDAPCPCGSGRKFRNCHGRKS